MSFATFSNLATMVFCAAVLVQSVRLMRAFRAVKDGALAQVVGALDQSTNQARQVLAELKSALGECGTNLRTLGQAREMAEELSVMIGIADATAERLVNAASAGSGNAADQDRESAA